jgi:CRP-like cAMP-binding protein
MTDEKLTNEIAKHPFVKGMKSRHVEALASCGAPIWFPRNEMIFAEKYPANRFYLILEGKVALETDVGGRGMVVPIQTLGPGEELGWSWLLAKPYYHFDGRAVEATRAIAFHGDDLRKVCEQDHDFGYELFKRMSESIARQLEATDRRLEELCLIFDKQSSDQAEATLRRWSDTSS